MREEDVLRVCAIGPWPGHPDWFLVRLPHHRTALGEFAVVAMKPGTSEPADLLLAAREIRGAIPAAGDIPIPKERLGRMDPLPIVLCTEHLPAPEIRRGMALDDRVLTVSPSEVQDAGRDRAADLLLRTLVSSLSLLSLSPYQYEGPVTGSRFVARTTELNHIVELGSEHYLIMGVRRLGKSSLLRQAAEILERRGVSRVLVTAEKCPTAAVLMRELSGALGGMLPKRFRHEEWPDSNEIARFFREATAASGAVVKLFLDEAHLLLAPDRALGYPLAHGLRAAAEARHVRLFLAGGLALSEATGDKHPFGNIGAKIRLKWFSREEVKRLALDPMKGLEVQIRGTNQFVNLLLGESGGNPQVAQYLMHRIVQTISDRMQRHVSEDELRGVAGDQETVDYYRGEIEEDMTIRQRFVYYDVAERHAKKDRVEWGQGIGRDELIAGLAKRWGLEPNMARFNEALLGLLATGVLAEDERGRLMLGAPLFARVAAHGRNLDDERAELLRALKAQRDGDK